MQKFNFRPDSNNARIYGRLLATPFCSVEKIAKDERTHVSTVYNIRNRMVKRDLEDNMTPEAVSAKYGIRLPYVLQAQKSLNGKARKAGDIEKAVEKKRREARIPQRICYGLSLTIPEDGSLEIKLDLEDRGRHGTLLISEQGIRFIVANGKTIPKRELSWDVLHQILNTGVLKIF